MATPSEKIQEFVDYVHTLKGDENGQAQVFTTDCSGRNTAFRLGTKLSNARRMALKLQLWRAAVELFYGATL